MKLYIEVCNVLKCCSDSKHTEYDVTCIVCDRKILRRHGRQNSTRSRALEPDSLGLDSVFG